MRDAFDTRYLYCAAISDCKEGSPPPPEAGFWHGWYKARICRTMSTAQADLVSRVQATTFFQSPVRFGVLETK
jgi:hypothetical protein